MKRSLDLSSLSLFLLSLLGLMVWAAGCGGLESSGSGSVTGKNSGPRVLVVVKDPSGAQGKSLEGEESSEWGEESDFSVSKGTVLVKPSPTKCTLTISADDMTTIKKEFNFSKKVAFEVSPPPGFARKFDLDCIDTTGTTQNITVGYEASTVIDIASGKETTTVNLNPKFRNLIGDSDSDTTLLYARMNQPNRRQTRVTFGFGQPLNDDQLLAARCVLEFDTPGKAANRGVIDTSQTNGLTTATKTGPYVLLVGGSTAPRCEFYDRSDVIQMALTGSWETNADGNTDGLCTFGITQFKTTVDLDQKGQFAVACSLTGAGGYDVAPTTGFAKYDLSPNTNDGDVTTLIANGSSCATSRNGETCASGYCFNGTCMAATANNFGTSQTPTVVAGNFGNSGSDDGSSSNASFNDPTGVALDREGKSIYITDRDNHSVRRVNLQLASSNANYVTRYAGTGSSGNQNSACGSATFNTPRDIVVDPDNSALYVSQGSGTGAGSAIRKVTLNSACAVSNIAGSGNAGYAKGTGTAAHFRIPRGLAIDSTGDRLYVADSGNHIIRIVILAANFADDLAGAAGYTGLTDGTTTVARFNTPVGIAVDPTDSYLYVTDQANALIRKINLRTGAVTRLSTSVTAPTEGIVVDPTNTYLYVSDDGSFLNGDSVFRVTIADGTAATVVNSNSVTMGVPNGLTVDPEGDVLYFVDSGHVIQSVP